jgi:vitamin B12 transporter
MDRCASALTLATILALALISPARADENPSHPSQSQQYDVVVTATRVETPEKEIASSVTVITEQELLRTRKATVLEALADLIGLSVVQNGGPGAAASVLIRGANSEHTLVLIDGIPINDPINPSRSCDLSHLLLNQVERVEILRGPQSPLYGSDAMGGVINIITRRGHGRPRLSFSGSGGSYGTANGDFSLSGSSGAADYSLGLSAFRTTGVSAADAHLPGNSEPDGYRNLSLSGRFGYAMRKNLDLDVMIRAVTDRTGLDDMGGPYGDDPNDIQRYRSMLAGALLRGLFLGNRWEQRLSLSWIGSDRRLENPPDDLNPLESEYGTYGSGLVQVDWQNNFFISPAQTLTAGLAFSREQGHSDYTFESPTGVSESSFPDERAEAAGLYVQDQWKAGRAFFLAAGARLDVHSRTGTALTYRIAPALILEGTGTKFRATLGTGFKSPSLYQLFAPPTSWGPIGNADLRPERVTGWDAGVDQDFLRGRVRLGLTYFSDSFRDLIDFDYLLGYVNVGRAKTSGLEMSLESAPLGPDGRLRFRASYTRLTARDQTTGAPLLRRPRDKFSADISSQLWKRFDFTASVLFVGRRADQEFSTFPYETVTLPGYVLLGAVLSKSVGRSFDIFLRLDNILNARYEEVWGYGTYGFTAVAGFRLSR